MELEFELLKPENLKVGDLFLDASRVSVSGVIPGYKASFVNPSLPPQRRPRLARMPFIEPYQIYEVTQQGFKYKDHKGEQAGEHRFGSYFGGMVIPKDPNVNKLYVGHQFLAYLRQLRKTQGP